VIVIFPEDEQGKRRYLDHKKGKKEKFFPNKRAVGDSVVKRWEEGGEKKKRKLV